MVWSGVVWYWCVMYAHVNSLKFSIESHGVLNDFRKLFGAIHVIQTAHLVESSPLAIHPTPSHPGFRKPHG